VYIFFCNAPVEAGRKFEPGAILGVKNISRSLNLWPSLFSGTISFSPALVRFQELGQGREDQMRIDLDLPIVPNFAFSRQLFQTVGTKAQSRKTRLSASRHFGVKSGAEGPPGVTAERQIPSRVANRTPGGPRKLPPAANFPRPRISQHLSHRVCPIL
jgi:hypothetical protein